MSMSTKLPESGIDAVGADTYTTIINGTARECSSISIYCATHPVIISLDDGTTDHIFVAAGVQQTFTGMVMPKGAVVQGKNGTAGQNYTALTIAVW